MDYETTLIETFYHGHIDSLGEKVGSVIFDGRYPPFDYSRRTHLVRVMELYMWHRIKQDPVLFAQFTAMIERLKAERNMS